MTVKDWGWYASGDEENYTTGPEATRDAIIQAATNDEVGMEDDGSQNFHIMEAWQADVDVADHFDAIAFIDGVNDELSEFSGEDGDPIVDLLAVDTASLQISVRAAITQWQADNNLRFRHWKFSGTRNGETIALPKPIEGI